VPAEYKKNTLNGLEILKQQQNKNEEILFFPQEKGNSGYSATAIDENG
jgi:hypothetical protein